MTRNDNDEMEYAWKEWEMMNKDQESAIDIPGELSSCVFTYSKNFNVPL